jgi:hypothetical protein
MDLLDGATYNYLANFLDHQRRNAANGHGKPSVRQP